MEAQLKFGLRKAWFANDSLLTDFLVKHFKKLKPLNSLKLEVENGDEISNLENSGS